MNRNATRHYVFKFSNGEVITEKCRNSFGGFDNLVTRLAKTLGVSRLDVRFNDGESGTVGDLSFTITEVDKNGMILA